MSLDLLSNEEGIDRHPDRLAAGPGRNRAEDTTMNRVGAAETTGKSRNPITIRRINIMLSLLVAGLLALRGGELVRRAEYLRTDAVTIDGHALHLDHNDAYMTRVVLSSGAWEAAQTALTRRLLKPGDTFVDVG